MGRTAKVEGRQQLLLTVVEAAAMLGVGRTTAYELIGSGQLQVVHIGRSARVPVAAVHRYVERLTSQGRGTIRSAPRTRDASQLSLPFTDLTKD